jgi:hypothetical protein
MDAHYQLVWTETVCLCAAVEDRLDYWVCD